MTKLTIDTKNRDKRKQTVSTDLKTNDKHPFLLTRYWGGDSKGTCIQVTGPARGTSTEYIGMTREEALGLSVDLSRFAMGKEEELE